MRRSTALCCSLLMFVTVIGAFHYGWSQEVTASVAGTITDQSGASVPGATVTATSQEQGLSYTDVTNDTGLYRIAQLPAGTYTLKVQKSGFALASYPPFVLTVNQVARIDVAMKVGRATETVEVSGEAPILKTETTQVDTVIDAATNDNLPLASRNYVQLTLLAPGAVSTDPSSFNNGNNTAGYGGRPLINGNREQANNFLLDGMDNNQVSDNLLGYTPSPDAIEEFNLITNNAPAEFGNFEGGIVNATIKSGTNRFHGDVWEFFRNDVLNANSWSNNLVYPALEKAKLRWNMFGGTFGGPIIKNRLFFFADFQDQRFDIPSSSGFENVFTAAERGGNFGDVCTDPLRGGTFVGGICQNTGTASGVQLYNPCASFTAPCTPSSAPATTRQPFPNNVIPAVMMSPVAGALFGSTLYPGAISTSVENNSVNISNSAFNEVQGDLKIDFKATQKDNISYRFTRAYQNNPSANSQELLSNAYATTPIYNTVGDWSRTIGNNLVNDFRVGWSHITLNSGNSFASGVGQFGNTLGIGNGNPGSLPGLLALNFSNSSVSNIGAAEQTQSFDDHVWQIEDALSWTHGRHNFKFGGQWWRQLINTFYAGNNGELGLMDFNGQFTAASSSAAVSGDGGADFFLGLDYQYGRGVSTGQTWQQTSDVIGIYAQDTWQVAPRFTVNLGLRYDAHMPWVETHNEQANYNFTTGNIDLAGQNGASRALYDGTYGGKDFQPRIGFAWTPSVLGDHTVLRGAFTISSYLEGTGTNLRLPLNPPFTPAEINQVYSGLALPLTDTTDGIVGSAASASCAAPAYACYAGDLLRVWDPKVQPAIADEWNFTGQHQFAHNTTLQVGYVGQRGTHLMVPFDYAQRVLLPNSSCATPPCTAPSPYFAANPDLYSALGNGGPGATVSGTKSNGTMRYNSLQAVLQKQMTHGLQYQVAYTLSKCMSDSTGYYGAWNNALSASAYWQNVYDQKSEYAPCYYDATHVVSAYAIYDLPFGRGKMLGQNVNRAVNGVIGNWEVSPIISYRTGWPLPIYGAEDNSGTFSRGARADCDGVPSIVNTSIPGVGRQWFNNSGQFTNPSVGTFGNCSPQLSDLRSPHYNDVDLSLHKDFPITERFRVQFRSDFVNAFNHVQYNAPNVGLGAGMGQITSAQPPRNIQLALKLYY
jgi:outer membrane receptor protein involved in Fe transport